MSLQFSEKTDVLFKALMQLQQDCGIIGKDAENPHFKSEYVSLEKQWGVVKPLLKANGLMIIQAPGKMSDGVLTIETCVIHVESGQFMISAGDMSVGREGPQAVGSAITYARRYFMQSVLSIVAGDDDDDGEAAEGRKNGKVIEPPKTAPANNQLTGLRARKEAVFKASLEQGNEDPIAWASNILKRKVDEKLTLKNEAELKVLEAAIVLQAN